MNEHHARSQSSAGGLAGSLLDVNTEDPVQLRRGRLVNLVILVSLGITLLWLIAAGVSALVTMRDAATAGLGRPVVLAVVLGMTYALNRRAASSLAGLILSGVALAGGLIVLVANGPLTTGVIALTVPVLIAALLGPPASAFLVATLAGVAYGWLNMQHNPAYLAEVGAGTAGSETMIVYLNLYIIAALGWLFSRMAGRAIRESHEKVQELLQQQKALKARLDRQALGLRGSAQVARALAGSRDLNRLLKDAVDLVQGLFQYDTTHIFLVDETREYAVLRATSSEAGRELLAREHKLRVGSVSVVGRATDRGEPAIGDTTNVDLQLQRIEQAPDIRAEVALPLKVGSEVIGALHLQSTQPLAFGDDDLPVLQALADQIAVALANARLVEEAQRNLRELTDLSREATRRGWRAYLAGKGHEDRSFEHGPVDPARKRRQAATVSQVLETGELVSGVARHAGATSYLAAPMLLRSEVVGVVGVERDGPRQWTQDDLTIIQSIADRTTLAVENARLFEQAHRTAQREQLINMIAARLQRAPDLPTLLEGLAVELSEALGTDEVYAELTLYEPQSDLSPNGDGPGQRADVLPGDDAREEEGLRRSAP